MPQVKQILRVPVVVEPYPGGGFSVRSPLLPELISEGATVEDALRNAQDAVEATVELYSDLGRALPPEIIVEEAPTGPIGFDLFSSLPA